MALKRVQNIIGLAYPSLLQSISAFAPPPFLDKYVQKGGLRNVFSLNLCPDRLNGNFMTVGKIDDAVSESSIQYTQILADSLINSHTLDFYNVGPTTLSIDGESSSLGLFPTQSERYLTIVDSGTSLLLLPKTLMDAIGTYYKATQDIDPGFWDLPDNLSNLQYIDPSKQSVLKDLVINFPKINGGTIAYHISPRTYTLQVLRDNGQVGLISLLKSAQAPMAVAGGYYPGVVVLGEVFMQNAYTVFDREQQQIGFMANKDLCRIAKKMSINRVGSHFARLQPHSLARRWLVPYSRYQE